MSDGSKTRFNSRCKFATGADNSGKRFPSPASAARNNVKCPPQCRATFSAAARLPRNQRSAPRHSINCEPSPPSTPSTPSPPLPPSAPLRTLPNRRQRRAANPPQVFAPSEERMTMIPHQPPKIPPRLLRQNIPSRLFRRAQSRTRRPRPAQMQNPPMPRRRRQRQAAIQQLIRPPDSLRSAAVRNRRQLRLRPRRNPKSHLRQRPQSPHRPGAQARQVKPRHILNHPPAEAQQLPAPVRNLHPQNKITRRPRKRTPRPGQPRRQNAPQCRSHPSPLKMRRLKRQRLIPLRQRRLRLRQKRPRPRAKIQLARLIRLNAAKRLRFQNLPRRRIAVKALASPAANLQRRPARKRVRNPLRQFLSRVRHCLKLNPLLLKSKPRQMRKLFLAGLHMHHPKLRAAMQSRNRLARIQKLARVKRALDLAEALQLRPRKLQAHFVNLFQARRRARR